MQTRFMALSFTCAIAAVACGSSTESEVDGLSDASSSEDAATADSASDLDAPEAIDDAAMLDSALPGDAGDSACVPQASCDPSLIQQGAVVASTYESATAPLLMGGTIHDGTYVLTKQTYYEREANGPAQTTVQTIRWICGVSASIASVNSNPASRTFAVVTSLSSTALTETVTNCNNGDGGADANTSFVIANAPFEATLTTLTYYIPDTKVMLTYTKL